MRFAVCVKQVPDLDDLVLDPDTLRLRRDGPAIMNPFDRRAMAEALHWRDALGSGHDVVVGTMGPPQAEAVLREALAAGADRAVHLSDRAFAGADTLATARALAAWLRVEAPDVVFCGRFAIDADTGQVGPELAALLGWPHVSAVRRLDLGDARAVMERETELGWARVEVEAPFVLTGTDRWQTRRPTVPRVDLDRGRTAPVELRDAASLGDPAMFGAAGSPTWVAGVRPDESPRAGRRFAPGEEADVVAFLHARGALRSATDAEAHALPPLASPGARAAVLVADDPEAPDATAELLAAALPLARATGGCVAALGFDSAATSRLAAAGADRVLECASGPFSAEVWEEVLVRAISHVQPDVVLMPGTVTGRDVLSRAAAVLGLGLTGDAVALRLDDEGRLVADKPAFGGRIVAPIMCRTNPQCATVRPGVYAASRPDAGRRPPVEMLTAPAAQPRVRIIENHVDAGTGRLAFAESVLAVGAGVGGPEAFAALESLRRALDADWAASRKVCDLGWLPRQMQVGISGRSVAPRLYVAVAVRGHANHTVGIRRAGTVLAINTDPEAPIFDAADAAIVGDWREVAPRLADALQLTEGVH